jgi:chromate transport protein ChrA
MMEAEVVRRRHWLTPAEFLDLLGATNLIPGPNSTELAIHIGYRRAGWPGLIVAGACFILPAMLIVSGDRVGVRALREITRSQRPALRRETRHHRHRRAGVVELWASPR